MIVALHEAQTALRHDGGRRGSTSSSAEARLPTPSPSALDERLTRRAVRPHRPGRPGRVDPRLDDRLPGDDRAHRGARPVRRRVPHLQHPVDDRRRAGPRGRPAPGGRGDPPPGQRARPRPGARHRAGRLRRSGSSSAPASPALVAGYLGSAAVVPIDGPSSSSSGGVVLAAGRRRRSSRSPRPSSRPSGPAGSRRSRRSGRPGAGRTIRARLRWLVVVFVVVAVAGLGPLAGLADAGDRRTVRWLAVYGILLVATLLTPFLLGPLGALAGAPLPARRARARSGSPAARSSATGAGRR